MPLWAALCFSLLLTRARRGGPVLGAAVLLWLMAGQDLPRRPAAGPVAEPGKGQLQEPAASAATTRECVLLPWPEPRFRVPAVASSRPRVRSLLCRELPPARAPDRAC
jgi:hypothetical protein